MGRRRGRRVGLRVGRRRARGRALQRRPALRRGHHDPRAAGGRPTASTTSCDLTEAPPIPYAQMAADLEELIGTVQQPHLRQLLDRLLDPGTEVGQRWHGAPAAKYYHQAYRHGLLEHCLSVAQGVSALAATFPAHRPRRGGHRRAAARHRQGRGIRLDRRGHRAHRRRQAARRDPARLLPRAPRDRGASTASRPTTAQAVLHIILSHHGKLEHGSPVVPCTREATLVHLIDNLGGNLGSFDRIEKSLADGEPAGRSSTAASRHRPTSGPASPRTAAKPLRKRACQAARPQIAG